MKKWALVSLLMLIITAVFFLPLLTPASNCGGNSAALNQVKYIALEMELAAFDAGDQFDVATLPLQSRTNLSRYARSHWTANAKYFIRKKWHQNEPKRGIVAVCDTVFSNVPQPTFWNGHKKTPAHAVAYSDGTKGLVSETEFSKMDFSEFLDLNLLAASLSNAVATPQPGIR